MNYLTVFFVSRFVSLLIPRRLSAREPESIEAAANFPDDGSAL